MTSRWAGAGAVFAIVAMTWHGPAVQGAQTSTMLEVRYADGRTTRRAVDARAGSAWTGSFPRAAGVDTSRDGLPLAALEVTNEPVGETTGVTVSLLYGRPHQRRIEVDTVTVPRGASVTVDRLTRFGVDPIAISIVEVATPDLGAPTATSISRGLDVTVEPTHDRRRYRVVVVNKTDTPVLGFQFVANRRRRLALSAYHKAPRRESFVAPGEGVAFEIPGSTGGAIDGVGITSVTWADGTFEGDPGAAFRDFAAHAGIARQLTAVLTAFRDAADGVRPRSLADVRGRIGALAVEVPRTAAAEVWSNLPRRDVLTVERVASQMAQGMQQAKDAVLGDFDAFVLRPSADVPTAAAWLSRATGDYEEWIARIEGTVIRQAERAPVFGSRWITR